MQPFQQTRRALVGISKIPAFSFLLFSLCAWLALAPSGWGGLNMNLHLYAVSDQGSQSFFGFPELSTNGVTANPIGTGYLAWGPTSTSSNGIHYELHADGNISGGSSGFSNFESFAQALNGNWTLLVTNAASTNQYTFSVNVAALSSTSFPSVVATYPANHATEVETEPVFTWTGPAQWNGSLDVFVHDETYSYFRSSALSPAETSWPSPQVLSVGTNVFRASYLTNITALVAISEPVDVSSDVFPGWVATSALDSYAENQFMVGTISPSGHTLVAHYAFDQFDDLGLDSSGLGNHIFAGGSFGFPEHDFSSDSISGDGAVDFFGFSYMAPPTNVLATLWGDFSVSAWIKTTQARDEFDSGIGIVWAGKFDITNDVVPMSLVQNKMVFFTGSSNGTEDSLFSETDINIGDYVHVVVTRSQSTGEKKIYIDGALDAQNFAATGLLDAAKELFDLQIGAGFDGYEGLLDDLQFYEGVLSADDVQFLFDNPGETVPDLIPNSLGTAVDALQFSWTTGGDANWFSQTNVTHDDIDAAQAGAIFEGQNSWISTTIQGPGEISFWWNINDDSCTDEFSFSIDGFSDRQLYCSSGWTFESVGIPPGVHTLEWRHTKFFPAAAADFIGALLDFPEGAWLDEVSFTDQVAPHILGTPSGIGGFTGTNLTVTVPYYANPQPTFTWFRNNVLLPTQTNATLSIPNAQPTNSGFYYMVASNYLGTDTSGSFYVDIVDPTDLRPLSLTAPANSRGSIAITWTVTNTGPASITNWWDQVFLVTNGTVIWSFPANRLLPTGTVIPPQGSYTLSNDYRLPAIPSGNYELRLVVDVFSNIRETNELNNTLTIPFTFNDVDIQPGNIQTVPVSRPNQPIQISWNTTNNGPASLDGGKRVWDTVFFISTDEIWDPEDILFDDWGIDPPNLAPGEHFTSTVDTFLPTRLASGNYFLIVYDDFDYDLYDGIAAPGILFESNENNNYLAVPLQIVNPDLTPISLLAPGGASPRQPIQVQWSVQNIGDAIAENRNASASFEWSDRLFLSTNTRVNASSFQLGVFNGSLYSAQTYNWTNTLLPGQSMTNVQTIQIPNVAAGNYFIVLTNDYTDAVVEFNNTNNSIAIPIVIGFPDLVVTNVTAPASVNVRDVIPVIWEVQNKGFGIAYPNWRDRVYLSTNDTYQTNDIFLGEVLHTDVLFSNANYFATNFVTMPGVTAGNYFLLVRTDVGTNLFESNTNNNLRAIPINVASPDLAVSLVSTTTNLSSQQPLNLYFVVTNLGGTTALPPWVDRLYLSTNATLDAADVPVPSVSSSSAFNFPITTPLPVGGSYTQQVDVRIPLLPARSYFLLVQTDGTNSFSEVNETNNIFATAVRIENPDLTPTNFIAPTSVTITQLNQKIDVAWNVLNQGAGIAYENWADYIYISPTNILDTNAVHIGSENPPLPLGAGQSYLAFDDPTLPNGIQGRYYLLLKADAPNNLYESSETNNLFVRPIDIVIPPLADLSLTEISGPSEAWSGQEIEIRWVLTNSGTAAVTQPFNERLFLATSSDGSSATLFGTFAFTGTIAPGESVERKQRITLPISMSGLRWPVVVTDSGNDIFEFNRENNNSLVMLQPINVKLSPFPNLTVTNIVAPTNVFSGQKTVVSWVVTNSGTGPTSSPYWYDSIYLSTDAAVGNDTHLANVPNASYLNPGESYVNSATVTLPRGIQGTYYFIIRCDAGNYVFESTFENDNVTVSPSFFIDLTPPPDLRVTTVKPPLNAFSGQSVSLTWAVTNAGLGQTLEGSWYDRVYLSADTNLDGGDFALAYFPYTGGGLEPGQSYTASNSVAIPVGISGDYYFIVTADAFGNVFEVPFEENNSRAATSVTSIALTPPPDLVTAIQFAPTNATSSRALSIRFSVSNKGSTTPPDGYWHDRLTLSTDAIPSPDDIELATLIHYNQDYYGQTNYLGAPYLSHMAPGASYVRTISAILPNTLTGTYHILVTSDFNDNVFELDNTNNTAVASNLVTIVSQPADLLVTSLTAPKSAEAGNAVFVSWNVENKGVGDSAVTRWYDRLILSADDFLGDSDDIILRDVGHDGLLDAGSEYSVSNALATIPIDVLPGQYRLFLIADRGDQAYESKETNNVFGPVNITITRNTADLQIANVIAPTNGVSGSYFTVQWVEKNFGTRAPNSSSWADGVYLSTDTLLSPNDLLLGRRQNRSQLAPGESYTNSVTAKLPENLQGHYYVIVVADEFSQVVEAGLEDNNIFVSTSPVPIVLSPVADLAVNVNAPSEAFSGQIFDLEWTVQNIGGVAASNIWYDAVYLSLDHFLDPFTDFYLGYRSRVKNLAPGESYTNKTALEIPQGISGPYYVFVATDTGGHIFERTNENNNIAFDPEAMVMQLTPPVDLVAGPITIPANAVPGVNMSIVYTVSNFGSNTARGSWEDAVYISADTNFDAGDSLLGRVAHRGDITPNSSYTNSITAPLPGVLPGDYHVIVRSDILNHIPESNEINNLGASLNSVSIDAEVLVLGTPDNGLIDQGQSVYYKFDAVAGQTIRLRFTTDIPLAGNEVYVRYAQMPSRGQFDFAINEPFIANPDLFIPIEHTGTHYLLVYSGSMPVPSPYTILAEVLPFSVATVQPGVAGDRGSTTFKIQGALFDGDTRFQLTKGTKKIPAANVLLENSSTAYATFNLVGAENGAWNLSALMDESGTVISTLSNSVTVISDVAGGVVSLAIDGPLSVWAAFTQRILLFYGNEGSSDVSAPLFLVRGPGGTRVGTDINLLRTNVLQLLGRSLDGPPDILRPQSSHSHTLYYRGGDLHVEAHAVTVADTHPITDNDWLEIESSVRPAGISDADWVPFWANNIRPRVGSTWGDYVKFLQSLAKPFPAEQRDVQSMFAYYITNQSNFHASSIVSGVVLDSTNNLPLANIEIAFYSVSSNGAVNLGGNATTDINGRFLLPQIAAGRYVCAVGNHPEKVFDMNHDGKADENAPRFVVQQNADLLNQTIYLAEPAPLPVLPNDADAKLVLDSQNVLHAFWFRNDLLWHARKDSGNWVEAAPVTTNVVESFAVSASANLIDGTSPGIIVVWTQKNTNSIDLLYSVGQSAANGYQWSLPIRLTDDLVANLQPSVVVRDNGLALISYLKRGIGFHDDTDLYFSAVDVVSGELLRNDPAPVAQADGGLQNKQSFGWSKGFEYKPFGIDLKFTTEASGEFTSMDCDAGASFKLEGSAEVSNDDYLFNLKGTGEGAFSFYVDPDQCGWKYKPESSAANLGVTATFGVKNAAFKILKAYPPTAAFSDSLEEFVTGFGEYVGFEFGNSIELKIGGALQGLHWKEQPPFSSFGFPSAEKAEVSIGGAIKFSAEYDNEIELSDDVLGDGSGLNNGLSFGGEASVEVALKAQFYPQWDFLGGTLTPAFSIAVGQYKWAVPFPELVISDTDPDVRAAADQNPNPITGALTIDPASVFGTTNVYGTNAVLANVKADLLKDGAPALAHDAAGSYQAWFHEIDPFDTRFGSEIFVANFNGVKFNAPAAIPNSDGFNSFVRAATDSLGKRMVVWVHGDSSSVSTNSTFEEFFGARRNVNVCYSTFNGSAWSAPQPVAATIGPDADLNLSHLANGDVLAVWTCTGTNSITRLLSSRWNGTTWSGVEEIASGTIRKPVAQQVGTSTYAMWTKVERGTSGDRAVSLYQSINEGSGWSAPTLFEPETVAPDAPQPLNTFSFQIAAADSLGGILFGEIPEKCCKCKGKTTSVTNGPPRGCGVSFSQYDYENCQKIYTYKACSYVSLDPNDIVGPEGFGPERWVGKTAPMNYVIHFENDALGATAPAKEVIITMPLDDDFDPRTFRLSSFGFGDISINIPPGQAFYSTRLDYKETKGFYVDFFAGVDIAKREAFWRLTTIDPATGEIPINPFLGFLPPNVNSPEGEGFVAFSLQPKTSIANGTRVDAKATIFFDTQPPIDTPQIFNSIETDAPSSAVTALPSILYSPEFTLSWTGTDGVGGSGIAAYDIYVSENGGSYSLLAEGTTLESVPVVAKFGSHYAFYSIAHDNAGNIEDAPQIPDAEVTIATSNTPPVLLNFTNAQFVEKTLFTRQIEAGDADIPENVLTFALLDGPTGMTINSASGSLSWTPNEAQGPGTNTVIITVSDDATPPLSATNSFVIVVLESNEPPVFVSAANYTVNEGTILTFTNVVADSDIPANHITLELISAPTGVSFDVITGIVTWTPAETVNGSTNFIVVKATDDAMPPASVTQTNTIVVRKANSAPVLEAITNRVTAPLSLVQIAFVASDNDLPTNHLTFSLGEGSVGTVNATNGLFTWRPGLEFAGTSNVITAIVSDDGTPSLSATQQFVIAVKDFVRIELGETALFVNQTSNIQIRAVSSAPWLTLQFTLQLPTNLLGNVIPEIVFDPTLAATLMYLDGIHAQITFSNNVSHTPAGTNYLAQIGFKAIATNSAVLNLVPENPQTIGTNGQPLLHLLDSAGRITIIGERPVLDAFPAIGNQHSLVLFGNIGQTYQLETTTNLGESVVWEFLTNVTMTNIVQPVKGKTNSPTMLFYRARQ